MEVECRQYVFVDRIAIYVSMLFMHITESLSIMLFQFNFLSFLAIHASVLYLTYLLLIRPDFPYMTNVFSQTNPEEVRREIL